MKFRRLLRHPIIKHARSRFIFLLFLMLGTILGLLCRMRVNDAFLQVGLTFDDVALDHPFLMAVLSPAYQITLVLVVSWFAASLTAHRVAGPIKRLVKWVEASSKEKTPLVFRVRKDDKYYKLVHLINRLLKQI